jgi:21S rRNA (uridine2791-2'-O)-methyltransferase
MPTGLRAGIMVAGLLQCHHYACPVSKIGQVAVNRTNPEGRVIGIDLIPAQPPRGVSTIQGNFLSTAIQDEVRAYVREPSLGRLHKQTISPESDGIFEEEVGVVDEAERGDIGMEHMGGADAATSNPLAKGAAKPSRKERDLQHGRVVDVVLSDMSEPWDQTVGFYKKSLSDPYSRMMNTSGNAFRDHAGSMVGGYVVLGRCF